MSQVGRADHVVLQLRAELQRLARARAQGKAASPQRVTAGPLQRLRALEGSDPAGSGEFRKKFVRALMTEEFGEAVGNQPEFERITSEVWRLIEEDAETRTMLEEAIRQLGTGTP